MWLCFFERRTAYEMRISDWSSDVCSSVLVAVALREAAQRLAAVSDTPRLDAELLMAYAPGVERQALPLDPARHHVPANLDALVAPRLRERTSAGQGQGVPRGVERGGSRSIKTTTTRRFIDDKQ